MLDTILDYLYAGRYLAIYLGAILEGPIVMTATGFFIKLGLFKILPAYLLLILGDLTSDIGWYYIGYFSANKKTSRLGHFFGLTEEFKEKIRRLFKNHETKILFFSKLTMGFGFSLATLMTAGALRVNLKKYILLNFLGELFWVAFLLCLGYFLGNIYHQVAEGLQIIFIIAVVIIIILALRGLSKYFRKKYD